VLNSSALLGLIGMLSASQLESAALDNGTLFRNTGCKMTTGYFNAVTDDSWTVQILYLLNFVGEATNHQHTPVFKKRPNFLIRSTACSSAQFSGCSSTTNAHSETGQMAVCCQNLPLGSLSSRSAPSVLVGELFKKFGLFLNTRRFRKMQ